MIELTLTDGGWPANTSKTLVLLDQVTHVVDAGRGMTYIYFANGKSIMVHENIATVEKRFRDYAETAQKTRITAIVNNELAKVMNAASVNRPLA